MFRHSLAIACSAAAVLTAAAPAPAATAAGPLWGTVCNYSPQYIYVTYNLDDPWSAEALLAPGSCTPWGKDADAFFVEPNCVAGYTFGGRTYYKRDYASWVKVTDLSTVTVRSYTCSGERW